jgi:cation transport regulator ChaB
MVNSRPAQDELRAGYCRKQPAYCSPASDLNFSTLRFQRFRFSAFSFRESASALDQVNDHDDDRNHDQEMDETAADVADEAEKPEHEQDNDYSPEHGVPFDLLNWPL